jgi:hypothetical protein
MFSNLGWNSKDLLCYDHTPTCSHCSRKFERKLKGDRVLQNERRTIISLGLYDQGRLLDFFIVICIT